MKWIGDIRSKKYFLRILLTIAATVVAFLTVFFGVTYAKSKSAVMKLQQESVRNVLDQVDYNIDNLGQMVINLAISSFADRNITTLMNARELETFELTGKLETMDKIVASNSYLHSLLIYNGFNGCYFSTADSSMVSCGNGPSWAAAAENNALARFLRSGEPVVKLELVPTDYEPNSGIVRLFSVFMYKSLDAYHSGESLLMLNIRPEWLFDNVRTINTLGGNDQPQFYIMNANGQFFTSGEQGLPGEPIRSAIAARIRDHGAGTDYYLATLDGVKSIVTFSRSQTNGFSVINIQPYATVFGAIDTIKRFFILMLGLFAACSIAVSIWFAVRLYRPVHSLLDAIRPEGRGEPPGPVKDEFLFMSNVYRKTLLALDEFREKQRVNRSIVHHYKLRQFFADSETVEAAEAEQLFGPATGSAELGEAGARYGVIVLKFDDYRSFCTMRKQAEQQLIRFAVTNVCNEIVGRSFAGQAVDMRGDHCAAIVRLPQGADWMPTVAGMMEELQQVMASYYHISLTAVISETYGDLRQSSAVYARTEESALYRLLLGKRAIIAPADIARLRQESAERVPLPADAERKLAEHIRAGDLPAIEAKLSAIFEQLAKHDYDSAVNAILHVIVVANQTVHDINRLTPDAGRAAIDMKAFQMVFEQETLDDVFRQLMRMFGGIAGQRTSDKAVRQDVLVDTMKEIVEAHYIEPEMGLAFIADSMRMTPAYVGRLFKKIEQVSLIDYIHEVRMKHAIVLLQNESYSVAEIMRKVGYSNESHFFKLFKRKTGVTPNEYRKKGLYLLP
ncbi:MAG: helix-turn-helix domain-containing protein [Paenibacillaceae bacterium]|nr:helix-turn-helix domain-containing protein [Paenibacillaceae bacterium]